MLFRSHAEADLERFRRAAAEDPVKVDGSCRVRDAELRQQRIVRALLRVRDAALAQDKAADRTM